MSIAIAYTCSPVRPVFQPRTTLRSVFLETQLPILISDNRGTQSAGRSGWEALISVFVPYQHIAKTASVYTGSSITYVGDASLNLNNNCMKKLESFLDLEPNWDGYDAIPPTLDYIHTAEVFLSLIPAETDVYVSADGYVKFEFDRNDGAYLEIELQKDRTIVVYELFANDTDREYAADFYDVTEIVNKFYE